MVEMDSAVVVVVVVVWMDKAVMTVREGRIRIEDNLNAKLFAAAAIAERVVCVCDGIAEPLLKTERSTLDLRP